MPPSMPPKLIQHKHLLAVRSGHLHITTPAHTCTFPGPPGRQGGQASQDQLWSGPASLQKGMLILLTITPGSQRAYFEFHKLKLLSFLWIPSVFMLISTLPAPLSGRQAERGPLREKQKKKTLSCVRALSPITLFLLFPPVGRVLGLEQG